VSVSHGRRPPPAVRYASRLAAPAAIVVAYLAAALALLPETGGLFNPDGLSSISIAQHLAEGHVADAVNGYWSPLFPWLITPLLVLGLPPLLASKIGLILVGAVAIVGFWVTTGFLTTRASTRDAVSALFALVVLEWSMTIVTADLLTVAVVLWYLASLRRATSPMGGAMSGALGGLGYLAKALGLPLFVAHFTLSRALALWRAERGEERRRIAASAAAGFAAFLLVASPWILAVSWKYGEVTYSTAGRYNWALIGPETGRFMPFWSRLMPPPHPRATSIWEDPSSVEMPDWSVRDHPDHLAQLVEKHARAIAAVFRGRSPYVPIALVLLVSLVVSRLRVGRDAAPVVDDALLAAVLFVLAYLPFPVEERYLWPVPAVALAMSGYSIDRLSASREWTRGALLAVLAVSFVPPALAGINGVRASAPVWRSYREAAAALPPETRGTRLAASAWPNALPWVPWNDALYVAWLADLRYYGVIPETMGDEEAIRSLDEHQIETFLLRRPGAAPAYLSGFREIATIPRIGARVFWRPRPGSG
jgi:hypothetical protein